MGGPGNATVNGLRLLQAPSGTGKSYKYHEYNEMIDSITISFSIPQSKSVCEHLRTHETFTVDQILRDFLHNYH